MAKDLVQSALKASPGDADLWALKAFCTENYKEAATKAVVLNRKSALAHIAMALSKEKDEAGAAGLEDAEIAIKLKPGKLSYLVRGQIFAGGGGGLDGIEKALPDFRKAVDLDPNSVVPYLNCARAYFQMPASNESETKLNQDKALAYLSKAILINASCADAHALRGRIYLNQKDRKKAIASFSKAIEFSQHDELPAPDTKLLFYPDTSSPFLWLQFGLYDSFRYGLLGLRANAYKELGDYNNSLADLNELIKSDTYEYLTRGELYITMRKYRLAIDDFNACLLDMEHRKKPAQISDLQWQANRDSRQAYIYANRAIAHLELNEYKDAEKDAGKAIQLYEKLPATLSDLRTYAYFTRGVCFMLAKEKQKALADFSACIQCNEIFGQANIISPSLMSSRTIYGGAYMNRASIFYEMNEYEKASKDYMQAISLAPNNAELYCILGKCLLELGKYDEAAAALKKSASLAPHVVSVQGRVHMNMGEIYSRSGQHEKAISEFTKMIDSNRSNADSYRLRANSYFRTGNYMDAAIDFLRLCLLKPVYLCALLIPTIMIYLLVSVIRARLRTKKEGMQT